MDSRSPSPPKVRLILRSPEETRAGILTMSPEHRAQLSPRWVDFVTTATEADPWVHGFDLVLNGTDLRVGSVGFKGPPGQDRSIEIAYCVEPEHQGLGYATEAADLLVQFAFDSGMVSTVRAHTLPESNASTRVLTKCGFSHIGEVIDPEDGRVWRWERSH